MSTPCTPERANGGASNVFPTPPYSGPREAWCQHPDGSWRRWSADQSSPAPADGTTTQNEIPSPKSPSDNSSSPDPSSSNTLPTSRVLFPEHASSASTQYQSESALDVVKESTRPSSTVTVCTPSVSTTENTERSRDREPGISLQPKEPLFLPHSASGSPAPAMVPDSAGPLVQRSLGQSRTDAIYLVDNSDGDEILTVVNSEQERKLVQSMRLASVKANGRLKRRPATGDFDQNDDDDIAWVGTIRTFKRHKTERDDSYGACGTCGRSSTPSGKLAISGVLPRDVQARAIREVFDVSLAKLTGKSWEELAESFGADRAGDADRLRQWWKRFGESLAKKVTDGSI